MLYALNANGHRIDADAANKGEQYTCPICNSPVILKQGHINVAHFAHESNQCDDDWNYDMSEWHKRMQNYFPKESQEVVVNYRGRKHRADVLINDVVLEFQFSPITASEFEARNRFFKNAGYRLAWVFNLSHIPDDNLYLSDDRDNMMIWKHPMRIFANADYLGENNKRFALWFSFGGDDQFEDIGEEYLERVVWAIKDEDGYYSMRRFFTSDYAIALNNDREIDLDEFFDYERACFKQKLAELKNNHSFSIKYRGAKGKPRDAYMCPRKNGEFGISLGGEHGCYYCKHCYMVAQTTKPEGKVFASYCCYPKRVRELNGAHPGYECHEVDIFEL